MIGSGASPLSRWRAAARNLTRLTEAKILNRSSAQAAIIFAGAARLIVGGAFAVPFTPNDDNQVLERLPPTSAVIGIELRAMSAEIANSPDKQESTFRLAQKYVKLGREESDPRYYGYAEGLLAPWSKAPAPPHTVLLLRAMIKQSRHDFDGALGDLDEVLKQQPANLQAWLTRAAILKLRGRFDEARASCASLAQAKDPLLALTCLCDVASLTGGAPESLSVLEQLLKEQAPGSPEQRQWSLTVLAEIAARLGDAARAESYFNQAFKALRPTAYLLSAYSDFLLDEMRAEEVVTALADKTRIDLALLRLVLAKQRLKAPDLANLVAVMRERFAAGRRRGEKFHLGDEARFTLYFLRNPSEALRLAEENWRVQRSPQDARILYEAAIVAGNTEAARGASDFMARAGMERARLSRLTTEAWWSAAQSGAP